MDTIYNLQQRADALRRTTATDSITPETVGGLHADTLAYIADLEQNAEGLGIHKVYQTYAAMTAEGEAPEGTNGKPLRYGQLVAVYDGDNASQTENGNVYAWQKGTGATAWLLMGHIGDIQQIMASIATETAEREAADTAMAADIATETAEREAADTAMAADIATETAEREAADTAMAADIATETAEREAADTAMAADIATETAEREAADTAMAADIATETAAREALQTAFEQFSGTKGADGGLAALDADGYIPEDNVPQSAFNVAPFSRTVTSVEVPSLDGGTQSVPDAIAWHTGAKRFCGLEANSEGQVLRCYKAWPGSGRYTDDATGKPYTDKIYLNTAEAAAYCYANGVLTPLDTHITLGTTADTAFPGDQGASLQEDIGNLNGWREEAEEQMADTAEQCDAAGVVNATTLLGYGYQKPQAMTFADVLAKVWANDKTVKHPGVVLTYYTDKGWKSKQWILCGSLTEADWTNEKRWSDFGGPKTVTLSQDDYDKLSSAGMLDDETIYNVLEDE